MFGLRAWSVALVMGMVAVPAAAQEPTKRLEPLVVTATKLETPRERLGAAVTVITDEEIESQHNDDLGDVLRRVPGVEIQRSGSRGKVTSIKIRGAGSQQVQVLVDGLRVKSPTAGTVDFSDLAVDQIERIEIVRGPQATLYGADAIGGVVNIITKRGLGAPTGTLRLRGGNFGTHWEQASFGGSHKRFDYAVSTSFLGSGGQFDNDDSEQTAATLRLGLTLPRDGRLSVSTRHHNSRSDLPVDRAISTPPFFVLDPDAQQQSELTTLAFVWEQKPVAWYEIALRFGHFWNELTFRDPLTPGVETRTTSSDIDTSRREVELLNHFHAGQWSTLSVGLEDRTDSGDNRGVFSREADIRSAFVQDELRLFDRLVLSGGVRIEDHEAFGTETTGRVGAVYQVKAWGTTLRGTWGEGFRAPTLNDLFFPGFANPGLQPEESESWDAGVDQTLWTNRLRFGVTYFRNDFDNLIQFVPVGGLFLPQNVASARTRGVEATAGLDLLDTLLLTANYTFTDTENLNTGQELRRFAHHRWNAGLAWDPIPALDLFVQAHVVSSQFERNGFPRNPGYHRIDAGGTYRVVERRGAFPALDLVARIQNLTDEEYSEVFGFEALGINALAGLQARY